MVGQIFVPGAIVRIRLEDGSYGYGRFLVRPFVAFYDYNTKAPSADLGEITSKPILFTVTVHKYACNKGRWEIIGKRPLEARLLGPIETFIQDPMDPTECQIIDEKGNARVASIKECMGLERAAAWDANHVEDRLLDHYFGRQNK